MLEIFSFATFKNTISKSFSLDGRAKRIEFWNFHLYNILLIIPTALLATFTVIAIISNSIAAVLILSLFTLFFLGLSLFLMVTGITLSVRRLHDLNQSGWLVLICLIPFIGPIFYYIYLGCFKGVETNKY